MRRFGKAPYDRAIATSATAAAVICAVNHVPRAKRESADRLKASAPQVSKFYRDISTRDLASRRKVPGIGPKRAEIIVPGVAMLVSALREFHLPKLYYSSAGMRDGIIADLAARGVGRELSELDAEQRRLMTTMARRYAVPLPHARKVAAIAHVLFDSLQSLHALPPAYGKAIEAAAYLHDTGHYISDTRHHRHSFYLVENSDMPGFTERERRLIANLCRYHRKGGPSTAHSQFQGLDPEGKRAILLLTPLLRLADSLDRSNEQRVESLECETREAEVIVRIRSTADVDLEQWAGNRRRHVPRSLWPPPGDREGAPMKDSIENFAAEHAKRLSKKFDAEVRNTAKRPDEEPIHDLRVSIRRLSQCLSEFRKFLPHGAKNTRKRLGKLMDLAAEMRNRDIAIALVGTDNPDLVATLGEERDRAKRKLIKALDRWRRRDSS